MVTAKRKYQIAFYILLLLIFICIVLMFSNRIVFQWFGRVPIILACVAIVLKTVMGFNKDRGVLYQLLHCFLAPVTLIVLIIFIGFLISLANPREFQEEVTSPSGNTTIIIEYDLVSRPSIYIKRNAFFMAPVLTNGFTTGYNETIHFDIEWLSDVQIRMTNYLGEKFIVDLFP